MVTYLIINLVLFDCDRDGDLDVFFCCLRNGTSSTPEAVKNRLFLNDGRGNFTDVTNSWLPRDSDNDSTY